MVAGQQPLLIIFISSRLAMISASSSAACRAAGVSAPIRMQIPSVPLGSSPSKQTSAALTHGIGDRRGDAGALSLGVARRAGVEAGML